MTNVTYFRASMVSEYHAAPTELGGSLDGVSIGMAILSELEVQGPKPKGKGKFPGSFNPR
jgi:hypothetical protein